ncbi:MAG: hypothetical protein LBS87_00080 [Puniceicoccales bacterium]|nr:hypothetical protein [Puniceicoccales bacterium]
MSKIFLIFVMTAAYACCASGGPLSKFEVTGRKFGEAKILNEKVKCHSFAKKDDIRMEKINRYQFSKSCQSRGKITRVRAGRR